MNPGIVGSVISSGYLDIDIRGYNLPLITGQTNSITTSSVLIRCSEVFDQNSPLNEKKIIKFLSAHAGLVKNKDKANVSILGDYHYLTLLIGYLSQDSLSPKYDEIKSLASSSISSYLFFLRRVLINIDNLDLVISENKGLFDQDYQSFFATGTKQLTIKSLIALGVKAGIESTSYEDALRRIIYCGVNDDIAMTIVSIIAIKRGFIMEKSIESKAEVVCSEIPFFN